MSDIYTPPSSKLTSSDSAQFSDKQIKKIASSWRQLKLLSIAWGFFFVFPGLSMILLAIYGAMNESPFPTEVLVVFLAISAVFGLTIYGSLKRKSWGRILGVIVCALLLFAFPIGTFLGIVGLVAYSRLKFAFSPDGSLLLSQLLEERKAQKI